MKNISIIVGVVLLVGVLVFRQGSVLTGATGVPNIARIASSSTIVVGPQQVKTIFSAKSFCAGRLIGTRSQVVEISFDTNVTPTEIIGFPLAASTTNMLPSETYGCSLVKAYAVASTTITIGEALY